MSTLDTLSDIEQWCKLSNGQQDSIIFDCQDLWNRHFDFVMITNYFGDTGIRTPAFIHRNTAIEFNLIIGGRFLMGLSSQEENSALQIYNKFSEYADSMKPLREICVKPFFMTRFPILRNFALAQPNIDSSIFRVEATDNPSDIAPIYLSRNEASAIALKYNFQLPSEAQWEYAFRGNTKSLFYFGESLPSDDALESEILLLNFNNNIENAVNPFGLVAMNAGSWCSDSYHSNYIDLPNNEFPVLTGNNYVVRGGAATFWPWQDQNEWIMAMSAYRTSSDDISTALDGFFPTRFVYPLEVR